MTRVRPDIARAKRDGLDLDLAAVSAAGPSALTADDHYRLKTYGVCAQRQDDLFMVRMRVPAGRLHRAQVAAITDAARRYGHGWLHVTTRQNLELHSVDLADVAAIETLLTPAGVFGRSACGHTIRNVMACPHAPTSAHEPFDVTSDARLLSDLLVARSAQLNVALPSRLNIVLGGCRACGIDALTNDIGLVSVVRDGEAGYQLWAGGSLGTSPRLSILLRPFLRREEVWPAVWSIVEWFCAHRDGATRLKFVISAMGEVAFRTAFERRFAQVRDEEAVAVAPVAIPTADDYDRILAHAPTLGWSDDIIPERRAGFATVLVRLPLGDLLADEFDAIAELVPELVLTREQNIALPSIPLASLASVIGRLADLRLGPVGRGVVDVRACPGLSFCSLAITGSQPVAVAIEAAFIARPDLPRDFDIAVSGCPNSCTKHQVADVGLAGAKVRVNGRVGPGYQLFLGAVPGQVGEAVLRVAEDEAPAAVVTVAELWRTVRRPGETPGEAFRRVGLSTVASAVALRLRGVPSAGELEEAV